MLSMEEGSSAQGDDMRRTRELKPDAAFSVKASMT